MMVEGFCKKCHTAFDAHWTNYPDLLTWEAIMRPYCPYCKSLAVETRTDESNDHAQYYEYADSFADESYDGPIGYDGQIGYDE